MEILNEISTFLQQGRAPKVKELVAEALEKGLKPEIILNDALMAGMAVIGEKFKNNEVFVPEVLIAARAMNMGVELLKPHLADNGVKEKGVAVIGTIKGDLHDIGKNLVKMMMESKGITVYDLGVDVSPETFVEKAIEYNAQVICISALLTTTMQEMENVIKYAQEKGVREKFAVMVGGAPVTQRFCDGISADAYSEDAASAAEMAVSFCEKLNK